MANALVKISQLSNIGNNLSVNTLIPVVDTSGNYITDKTTVGSVANFILNEAGNILPEAFVSTLSYNVINAAQPNITSVGTLTGLTVSNLANFHLPSGVNGYVLQTNGNGNLSWTAMAGSGNGNPGGANTQVQFNDSGLFAGDSNLTFNKNTDTLNTVNIELVANLYADYAELTHDLSANVVIANYLYGDGSNITNVSVNSTAYANLANFVVVEQVNNNYSYHVVLTTGANDYSLHNDSDDNFQYNPQEGTLTVTRVDTQYLQVGNVISNITPWLDVTYNIGNATNRFNDIYLANSTIYLGNATISSNGNSIVVDSISISNGNVGTIGNIASINLNGNGNQVLAGNGTWVAQSGGGNASLPLANGNSNINIATANGPVTLTSAGNTWTIGTDGSLTAPNNSNIYPAGNNFNVFTPPAGSVQFYSDNGNYSWSLDGYGVMNLPLDASASNTASMYAAGNLRFNAAANSFVFTDTGAFVFPTLTVDLHNGGNQTAQTLQFGDDTQQAIITGPTPAANVNAQRLIIQGQRGNGTGEGGDVYFWAGDADTNGGDIKIYAGDADSGTGYGGYINLDAGNGPDGGGQLSLSGGYSSNGQGGTVYVTAGNGADAGDLNLAGGQSGTAGNDGGNANLSGGYGQNNGGAVTITGGQSALGLANYGNVNINSGASTWTFDNSGLLSLPGGYVKIGAQYGSDAILSSNVSFGVATQGNATTYMNWSDDVANTSVMAAIYLNAPNATPGDIHIRTGGIGNANIWQFNVDGNLVLPNGNSVIYSIANSSLDPTLPNVSTMTLTPDANYNSQVLVLDPTAPGHIHLRAYCFSNIDDPAANIFLGGEQTAFEVTSGPNNVAKIHSGNLTWTFSNTSIGNVGYGVLELPGESYIRSNQDTVNIQSVDANGIGRGIYIGSGGGLYFWDGNSQSVSLQQNNTNANLTAIGNVSITSNVSTWTLDTAGISTFPVVTYASLSLATTPGKRAFISDANLAAVGNFGATVGGGGSNTVPVYSDGTNWCIG